MNLSADDGVDTAFPEGGSLNAVSIALLGTSFKTAGIDFRERVAIRFLNNGKLKIPLDAMGILENSIIETCNRIELYLVAKNPHKASKLVLKELGGGSDGSFYVKTGLDAVNHIFSVASGLDSLVIGEEQILQQVRDAGRNARVSGEAKSVLSSLFDAAYNVGKRVRDSRSISPHGQSVSEFALEYGLKQLGSQPQKVLLIGTGQTAKLASLELKASKIYLLSRRRDATKRFPTTQRISLKQLKRVARECDLIIAATRRRGYVLKKGDIPDERRKVLLDLAFPRNIDPSVKSSEFLRLYDLDDLAAHARSLPKSKNLAVSERFIEAEAERFNRWLTASKLTPMLGGVYRWAENIRGEEVDLALRRLSQLSERDRRIIEAMSRRLVSKLMAPHAAFVKQQGDGLSQKDRLRLLEFVFGKENGG